MRKFLLSTTIAIASIITAQAQDVALNWAKAFHGSTGSSNEGHSIAIDASGNVYTTGYFQDTVDFDPGPSTYNLIAAGGPEIFVSKVDASGNFVWAKSIGGSGWDRGYGITVDALGNVYTTGVFTGTVDFDPGAGTHNLTSTGNMDNFISKLDASGNFVWAKKFGSTANDLAAAITVDGLGNVYTTGYFYGTVDFDPGAGTHNISPVGSSDIFISKLDSLGNFVWAKSFGGTLAEGGTSLAVDVLGNVYTSGYFNGTVDFDPGAGTYNLTSAGGSEVFISKLNASGDFIWAKAFEGLNMNQCNAITLDAFGHIYTTGYFNGTVDFDPGIDSFHLTSEGGTKDVFISKIDTAGNFVWAKKFGGTLVNEAYGIAVDAFGSVYTTGGFNGTVDFNPGLDTFNLVSAGHNDIFISKLDSLGNFEWAKSFGASMGHDMGASIVVDSSGNVHTTGYFRSTVDFDPGLDTFNITASGYSNIFILKLSPACASLDATITVSGTNLTANLAGATYQWIDCDATNAPIVGATAQSYTATTDGKYAVIVSQGLCSDTSDCQKINTVGIEDVLSTSAGIYPNPASYQVTITDQPSGSVINIIDILGKTVYSSTTTSEQTTISISDFANGVYLIRLENNGVVKSGKLIVYK